VTQEVSVIPHYQKEVILVENFQQVIQNQPPTLRKIGEIQNKRGIFESSPNLMLHQKVSD
jgi:hypothetical protein